MNSSISNLGQYAQNIKNFSSKFEVVLNVCKNLLHQSEIAKPAREYINSRISTYSQNKFEIGYFPSDNNLSLLLSLIDKEILLDLDLIYPSYPYQIFKSKLNHHNLIIPYRDDYGNIVGITGRSLLKDQELKNLEISKYKHVNFHKSFYLFGLYYAKNSIRKKGKVLVVEGQIDCITCASHGIHNVVALCGSQCSLQQFFLLKRNSREIYLLLDNDAAGHKATEKIIKTYGKYHVINRINLPEKYKDIDEYLKNNSDNNKILDQL